MRWAVVKYNLPQHNVGHQNDLGHLSLTLPERKELAKKIAAKILFDTILDDIIISCYIN